MKAQEQFRKNLMKQLGIAAAVLIPLIIVFMFLRAQITNATQEVVNAQKKAARNAEILETLSTLKTQHREFGKDYLSIIGNVLPSRDQLIDISKRYERLAQSEGIDFGFSFITDEKPTDSSAGFIQFKITVNAKKLDKITSFIKKLENFRFLTTIREVNIRRGNNGFKAKITGKVYYKE